MTKQRLVRRIAALVAIVTGSLILAAGPASAWVTVGNTYCVTTRDTPVYRYQRYNTWLYTIPAGRGMYMSRWDTDGSGGVYWYGRGDGHSTSGWAFTYNFGRCYYVPSYYA